MSTDAAFSETLAGFLETLGPLQESVVGYRARMISLGFSAESADAMAVQFHGLAIEIIQNAIRS